MCDFCQNMLTFMFTKDIVLCIGLTIWIPVVERVGPHGDPAERRRDGGVVHKELVRHHLELFVTAHSQVRGSNPCKMLI
jgi:hypothetical protein